MSDVMSITNMLARLRDDAADERFEGARLGPTAVRELLRHVDAMRRKRDELARRNAELAARLAEIEQAEPVAWIERITGRLAAPTDEHRTRFPMVYRPLIDRPTPAQRVSAADMTPREHLDLDALELHAIADGTKIRPACDWPGKCKHQLTTHRKRN